MRYGPLVFLAAFFALTASWYGFVLTPQMQLGRLEQATNAVNSAQLYPVGRPGLARQGLDVYRASGCAACHTEQVTQTGTAVDVVLTDAGTNPVAVAEALAGSNLGLPKMSAPALAGGLPKTLLRHVSMTTGKVLEKALKPTGATAKIEIASLGPDMERGWGMRRSVAEDFLYDYPVMPGSLRVGPDLANVGMRRDDAWEFRHLYAPRAEVKGSPMPQYSYLFEQRRIGAQPSPDALRLPAEYAPPAGYEIVPKPEAQALVAYLSSLKADVPLYQAPMYVPPAPAATNAPATNAPAAGAMTK